MIRKPLKNGPQPPFNQMSWQISNAKIDIILTIHYY